MKKRLESELISIAHRILKLKNKSEVDQLYHETQKLYETLSVLKFYNDNFDQLKSVVSSEELEEKIENSFVEKPIEQPEQQEVQQEIAVEAKTEQVAEEKLEAQIEEITTEEEAEVVSEESIEEVAEETEEENDAPVIVGAIELEDDDEDEIPVVDAKDDLDFAPIFEVASESIEEKVEEQPESKKQEPKQISFEDLLGQNYSEPVFVKPNDIVTSIPKKTEEEKKELVEQPKPVSLNEKLAIGINIGLNDRIGFVKNLFADSTEDYNRVISQLNTFNTLQEAHEFIEDMVKPDYNEWKGKEEYEERFMEIVAKKFV